MRLYTFANEFALNTGNAFLWHFDTKVAAGNHHPVAMLDDFIDVVNTFLVFYF